MNLILRSFVVVSTVLTSASAFALPLAPRDYAENAKTLKAPLDGYNFDGIVALNNCSGSLVRFQSSLPEENAMVLTNGHCLANSMGGGMPKPGVVIVDQAASRTMNLLDPSSAAKIGDVHATKILYATMTGTDVTLYLLKETYAEIENQYKIHALTLANRYPSVGEGIDVISGYWKRGYSCKVDGIVHELREAGWSMKDSIRYSRPGCETIGGTSGSPIVSLDTKEVVGVNNTGNENGEKCTMNNPCEVDENGTITYQKGISYGQQISWFYTCLSDDRKIDLNKPGCMLAKPSSAPTPPSKEPKGSIWPNKLVRN